MTSEQVTWLIQLFKKNGHSVESGLTDMEVLQVQTKFNIQFPPDLKLFLQTGLPTSKGFKNWRKALHSNTEADAIVSDLQWPLDGMLFDVKENAFWVVDWGDKPANEEDQVLIVKRHFTTYPILIPIYSHRYISSRPCEAGNPVISVYQMDIIYYGFDLATYFAREFNFRLPGIFEQPEKPRQDIDFWSDWTG